MTEETIYLSIQDHSGDRKLKLKWNPNDEVAAQHIEEMFKDLQSKGYRFFTCKKVFGLFNKKGPEIEKYDPDLGELIYEEPLKENTYASGDSNANNTHNKKGSLKINEVEKEKKTKYEEPKRFDPSKDKVDVSRDYVATKTMRAG